MKVSKEWFNYKVNEVRANMLSLTLEEMEDYYNQLDYNGCLFNSENSNYYRNLKKEVLAFANANSSYVTFQNESFDLFKYAQRRASSHDKITNDTHNFKLCILRPQKRGKSFPLDSMSYGSTFSVISNSLKKEIFPQNCMKSHIFLTNPNNKECTLKDCILILI